MSKKLKKIHGKTMSEEYENFGVLSHEELMEMEEIIERFRMMLERMDKLVAILQTYKLPEDAGVASAGHGDWLRDIRLDDIKII